jgi:hypothetical protein
MGHQPTIFYILENESLGTWYVGKMTTHVNCSFRSITQDELNTKLCEKYEHLNPYLTLVTLNKNWNARYGVERWISKMEYKIRKEPEKFKELEKLLKAGWDDEDYTETSTLSVLHVLRGNQPIDEIFKKLVKSREGLTKCLNINTGKTRPEKYQESKKDPEFMYQRARKEVLRQMKKTKKLPKPSTLEKYQIKEDEIKEVMEEEVPCQPCEPPKFYKKKTGNNWYCLCNKRTDKCSKVEGTVQRSVGSVYRNSPNKWAASYKRVQLGQYHTKEEAQEALDRYLKDPENFVKPDNKIGSVYKRNDIWGVNYRGKYIGGYDTHEEAQEALARYLKDPENFVKPEKKVGCVYKKHNKWVVVCKCNRLGSYETEEEAHAVLKEYIQSS